MNRDWCEIWHTYCVNFRELLDPSRQGQESSHYSLIITKKTVVLLAKDFFDIKQWYDLWELLFWRQRPQLDNSISKHVERLDFDNLIEEEKHIEDSVSRTIDMGTRENLQEIETSDQIDHEGEFLASKAEISSAAKHDVNFIYNNWKDKFKDGNCVTTQNS